MYDAKGATVETRDKIELYCFCLQIRALASELYVISGTLLIQHMSNDEESGIIFEKYIFFLRFLTSFAVVLYGNLS